MNRWLREGLASESFWRRALCIFLHGAAVRAVVTLIFWVSLIALILNDPSLLVMP